MLGTVLTGRNNIFTVDAGAVEGGSARYLCRLRGKTLALDERAYNPLAPGDLVRLAGAEATNRTAVITGREPRRNAFQRYNRKREALQTLGANLDLVVAVMSVSQPVFRRRFVDRVLALAAYHTIPSAVLVTKADLAPEAAGLEVDRYRDAGYEAWAASPAPGTGGGAAEAEGEAADETTRRRLADHRTLLVGQSGVGKSTLLNRLFREELQSVGEVSRRYERGRHTTNAAVLVRQGKLEIVDTPGIRELDCRHIPAGELDSCFADIRPLLGRCALANCTHRDEPECAVRTASEEGGLDVHRYESYLRLLEELLELQEAYP